MSRRVHVHREHRIGAARRVGHVFAHDLRAVHPPLLDTLVSRFGSWQKHLAAGSRLRPSFGRLSQLLCDLQWCNAVGLSRLIDQRNQSGVVARKGPARWDARQDSEHWSAQERRRWPGRRCRLTLQCDGRSCGHCDGAESAASRCAVHCGILTVRTQPEAQLSLW